MPYELRALEVALDTCVRSLDAEVLALEREAYPIIDRMAAEVGGLPRLHTYWSAQGLI
jgi:hypothetical protein